MTVRVKGNQWSRVIADYDPEYYQDTGCHLAPSCLNCPLPRCVEDDPQVAQSVQVAESDQQVLEWMHERPKVRVKDVADHWGISERTVYRIQRRVTNSPEKGAGC